DGIRDRNVTGVQTCALPISLGAIGSHVIDGFRWLLSTEVSEVVCNLATHVRERRDAAGTPHEVTTDDEANLLLRFADGELTDGRSEERRVGKECRVQWVAER